MDMTWVMPRVAVGGGIWTEEKMIEVVCSGVTHIIDMQIEFDDTELAGPYRVKVLWNPTDDDFRPKPPEGWSSRWRRWTMPRRGCSSTAPRGCIARP